ncbi:MAG TPA: glycoside-pentoside-hexuronide (GPH):cation symporter, partial [Longimicrobium sp.]|nr:glycoside-pentoside-hexuronide (GPH):cation symporter [Longimicrobium sp.]
HAVTVVEGIRARLGDSVEVAYAEGCRITVGGSWNEDAVIAPDPEDDRRMIAEAVEVAKDADAIVLAIGGNEQTSREAWSLTHMGDRTSLDLVGRQGELVEAMLATGKPVVVLLFNGRPLSIVDVARDVPAILECWYLGQETGHAVAELIFGDANPGGKLPISFPRSVGHLPVFYNHKPSARRGYLWDDASPLFPFGFGLSYTTFAIDGVRLEREEIGAGEGTRVLARVTNTGARAGSEVVQLYIRDRVSSVTRPVKELKGFRRVELAPGESAEVALEIGPDALAFHDVEMRWVVEPGEFEVMVGASSRDEDLRRVTLRVAPRTHNGNRRMASDTGRLSFTEKAGYSLGDAAANFVFMTMILFQLSFYTDTMGLTAAAAGTMLLLGRLWDAFFDPMMGVLADRTNTRWGKFRPWIIWTAIPWGVVMVLAYTRPGFSGTPLLIYAFVTNLLLMTLYSANNTPYSALSGVMTGDGAERTRLSSYRFVAAMIAQLVVGGFTLPLVARLGGGDNARGWQLTMALWAAVCVVCFVVTFATTRERIAPVADQQANPRKDFSDLLRNVPWIAMFVLTLSHFVFVAMRGGTMFYYFQYYVDADRLYSFLRGIGLPESTGGGILRPLGLVLNPDRSNVASVGFSLFNISSQLVTVAGVIASVWLATRFGKRAVALVGFTTTTVFLASFILMPSDAIVGTYLLEWVRAVCYAPTIPLIWAMFADVADFGEWKTGRRATGVIFATILFALKVGLSLGGAIAGWLLAGYGYRANAAQTPQALQGIRMLVSVYP